jgi:Uma2 family endonuclease
MERPLATKPTRLTVDDVLEIDVPDHLRGYELVDGELVERRLVSSPHGRIAMTVEHHLLSHIEAHGIQGAVYGDAAYVLPLRNDPDRLRGPDVSFVSAETLRARGGEAKKGWLRMVPDLVVEVNSPDRQPAVEQPRIHDYLEAGVRLLWIIHTDGRSATMVFGHGHARMVRAGDALEGDPVLPGLRLPLAMLFGQPESEH